MKSKEQQLEELNVLITTSLQKGNAIVFGIRQLSESLYNYMQEQISEAEYKARVETWDACCDWRTNPDREDYLSKYKPFTEK